MDNPFGMGPADLIVLALAAVFALFALTRRRWIEPVMSRLALHTGWSMLLLAAFPLLVRLFLLVRHPAPVPDVYDEFSHLLVAGTLRHFRLANPAHPMHRFFETLFVLQEPTYSSIYPPGQGLLLALGWSVFGHPWAGVLLAAAALSALTYWMLRAWTAPVWALTGGLLAAFEFGPLNQWTNSYWGGSLAAAAGCMVFGALPRLRQAGFRYGCILGAGLAIHLLTRPYESIFLFISILLFLPWREIRSALRPLMAAAAVVALAVIFLFLQNRAVTGRWTTLPYQLSQYQYGVPAALTFQSNPVPHNPLTPEQALDYKMQLSFRGAQPETLRSYFVRLFYRIRYYRFFFLPPLYVVLPFAAGRWRDRRLLKAVLCLLLFALGVNFFPAFQYHYVAGVTCLFVLLTIYGLQQLGRLSPLAARVIYLLCVAQFVLETGLQFVNPNPWSLAIRDPQRRVAVNQQLSQAAGSQLVFVRYWPNHIFQDEWVYNEADIDAARVVWARDLGAGEDEQLLRYYPQRTVWLLEPDARPPRLTPYPALAR